MSTTTRSARPLVFAVGGTIAAALFTAFAAVATAQAPTPVPTAPASRPAVDPALEAKLAEIDARGAKIADFTARFEQRKFTALLKKPLVSAGVVRVRGPVVRWDTERPEPAVLYADGRDVRMYYPRQAALEIYPIDRRMSDLAASPLPRLPTLRQFFSLEPIPVREFAADMPDVADGPDRLALRLRPTDPFLREHLDEVRVLLDAATATMLCVQTFDADGDRTVIRFTDVKLNSGIADGALELKVPPETQVSRPLEGAGK